MNLIGTFHMQLMLCNIFALSDAASVNVTTSSPNIQNGSSLTLTAAFDPTIGEAALISMRCEYSDPAGGAPTRLTFYNALKKQIVKEAGLSAYITARVNITSNGNPMVLVISPITFEDEKRLFYCILRYYDPDGNLQPPLRSEQYRLENVYSSAILNEVDSMQPSTLIAEGTTSNLTCIATGRPAPTITWQYNLTTSGAVSNTSLGSPLITVTSVLTIQNPSRALHNQTITCFVSHPFTSTMNRTTSIYVYYAPFQVQFRASPPWPINGLTVTFTCIATAEQSPSFRFIWVNRSSSVIVQDGSSTIYTTSPLDYKNYNNYKAIFQCISYNRAGKSPPQTLVLDIQVRPEISILPTISAVEGRDVVLNCKIIAANPAANITWLSPTGTEVFSVNGTALLPSVNRQQHGEYICLASNGIGTVASKATYLSVNYGPEFKHHNTERLECIGETVSINCDTLGRPTPDVFLYLNETLLKQTLRNLSHHFTLDSERKFGSYICFGNNTVGTVNVTSTFKMKSSGGVNNAIMHVKDNALKVTWQLPQCSGNIREIKVQYRKKGQSKWQWELKAATIADKEMTITGLEKGVEYEVRVVVVDTNGVTHETIGRKASKAGIQSSDSGALIGGVVGGICFLAITLLVCILVAKKSRQSSPAEERIGNTTLGSDGDITSSAAIKLDKLDGTHYMAPDKSVYANVKNNCDRYHGFVNKDFVGDSVGDSAPLSKDTNSS